MTVIQNIIAAIGFILCLPFVAAWVILAMIRDRNRRDGEPVVSIDERAPTSWLGRMAQRGRLLGEHATLVGRGHPSGASEAEVDVV